MKLSILTEWFGSGAQLWFFQLGFLLVMGVVIHWLFQLIYRRLLPRVNQNNNPWDDVLFTALRTPFLVLLWVFIISWMIPVLGKPFTWIMDYTGHLPQLRRVGFVLALFWFVMRFIGEMERMLMERASPSARRIRDKTAARGLAQLLRVFAIIVAVLVGMQTMGISVSTLLAVGGVGGIALGFAAKDTLANFIGGMMIFWDRPFCVGDWVRSPDREIEGTVEAIGWRLTKIRTFDKRPLYIPNGTFSTISVENPSRMSNRRIRTVIGLRYADAPKVAVILQDIETMLRNHPEIDINQTLMVNLIEFGSSSLNFFIYTFTKITEWTRFQEIQQDVFLKVIEIIGKHGAECAFPTTTVHLPDNIIEKRVS